MARLINYLDLIKGGVESEFIQTCTNRFENEVDRDIFCEQLEEAEEFQQRLLCRDDARVDKSLSDHLCSLLSGFEPKFDALAMGAPWERLFTGLKEAGPNPDPNANPNGRLFSGLNEAGVVNKANETKAAPQKL